MVWWEPEFCRRLAAAGRFVIRYDHRDTGRSVRDPPGSPGYNADDLVADAAGVLEALQCPSAHVVGISMGGALAQVLALSRPELVDSLTLISTSAGAGVSYGSVPVSIWVKKGNPLMSTTGAVVVETLSETTPTAYSSARDSA